MFDIFTEKNKKVVYESIALILLLSIIIHLLLGVRTFDKRLSECGIAVVLFLWGLGGGFVLFKLQTFTWSKKILRLFCNFTIYFFSIYSLINFISQIYSLFAAKENEIYFIGIFFAFGVVISAYHIKIKYASKS
ncbi:hypothetical protein BBF96_03845 [Anoxybacter fermentans]|uniref:Uncharacterized protein n=1 Tax=Anoxybacter fermentans TaxID=1323375 RepID=A0A3S9SWD4_9FIRM|nr:hypothetical protein [Anoxybacter fermentans]AZR72594.1 hypothetical protein BBF96_03845 [Anoxybacter fermentans]